MAAPASAGAASVVFVHGGFMDGSGWEDVHKVLKQNGHKVSVVQNPTASLVDDVAATEPVIAEQDGPFYPGGPFVRRSRDNRGWK